jgi:succinyl-diaminopimelate desuccinylase
MDFSDLSRWINAHVEEMVDLQAVLTAAPAINPENGGPGEWEKAMLLEGYLRRHGFEPAEHYDAPDARVPQGSRPNFMVRLGGLSQRPRIWIMTHLDVVPAGEKRNDGGWAGWDSDPFALRRDGGRIIGRGVEDNQQAIVASVFAARAVLETGLKPAHDVALLFVSGEETGSAFGLQYVLREHPHLFSPDDVILVPDGGNDTGSMIEVAEKSVLWLSFHVRGRQSHGSMPHLGCNAFRAAALLVCALDQGLRQRFNAPDALYDPPGSTFEPTVHEKNVPNVNTIPGEDRFCFDCRILPQFSLDDVLDYVREQMRRVDAQVGTKTELAVLNRLDAPAPTRPGAPAVEMLRRAVREVYGVEGRAMGIGGSTVAAFFRQAGCPAVVWSRTEGTAHQANESCLISNMAGDAKVFAHLFLQPLP